jgi:hypothetical protein
MLLPAHTCEPPAAHTRALQLPRAPLQLHSAEGTRLTKRPSILKVYELMSKRPLLAESPRS